MTILFHAFSRIIQLYHQFHNLHQFCPNNIRTSPRDKVKWIFKMITKGNGFDLLSNSFNKLIFVSRKCTHTVDIGVYCAFQKHANSEVQKLPSHLHFLLRSVIQGSQAMNLETQKYNKRMKSTNHKSQTMTFWTSYSKALFPKRSTKKIDSSKKCKRQLAFELQNLCFWKAQ